MIGLAGACLLLLACPAAAPDANGPGLAQVAHLPPQPAMDVNREGKALYRDGRFAEARAKYELARKADPDFVAPWLNLACAYAREDRFAEATAEAVALIRHAYVPGTREVMEAADLGALQIRPQWLAKLKFAQAEASAEWGRAAQAGMFFVGRNQPPVKLEGQGVLVLGMNQEIYAWLPHSGRYLPITAEDGRVLAFVQSPDGRRIVFVRAGRLVRTPGQPDLLRGLGVRQLDIPTMTLGLVVELPGDVRRLTLWFSGRGAVEMEAVRPDGGLDKFRFDGQTLEPVGPIHRSASVPTAWEARRLRRRRTIAGGDGEAERSERGGVAGGGPKGEANPSRVPMSAVVLTATGVAPTRRVVADTACGFSARDELNAQGLPGIRISVEKSRGFFLDARYGSGLDGLPFPGPVASPSKALSPARKTR